MLQCSALQCRNHFCTHLTQPPRGASRACSLCFLQITSWCGRERLCHSPLQSIPQCHVPAPCLVWDGLEQPQNSSHIPLGTKSMKHLSKPFPWFLFSQTTWKKYFSFVSVRFKNVIQEPVSSVILLNVYAPEGRKTYLFIIGIHSKESDHKQDYSFYLLLIGNVLPLLYLFEILAWNQYREIHCECFNTLPCNKIAFFILTAFLPSHMLTQIFLTTTRCAGGMYRKPSIFAFWNLLLPWKYCHTGFTNYQLGACMQPGLAVEKTVGNKRGPWTVPPP